MPSLRQVLAAHAPVLLLDTASSRGQVAWLENDGTGNLTRARWASSEEETGVSLFRSVESLGIDLAAAGAFIFCDGPGSVLGIRTAAMALRTWNVLKPRPAFAYCSLALVAEALGRPEVGVIADARRDLWHHYTLGGNLRRVAVAELPTLSAQLVMPENFRHWSPPPPGLQHTPYSLADLWPRVIDANLLRPNDSPDAFLHEEPSYVTWTPKVHRAPTA